MIRIGMRIVIIALACIAPFVFPSQLTAALAFAAALIFPPLAIILGMLTDLSSEPTGYLPLASIFGVVLCVAAVVVRSFVKARIM